MEYKIAAAYPAHKKWYGGIVLWWRKKHGCNNSNHLWVVRDYYDTEKQYSHSDWYCNACGKRL